MSLVPPRPDRPLPPPPGVDLPRATWRTWEAILVYAFAWLVSSVVTLPVLTWIRPEGVAVLVGSAIIAVLTVAILVVWLNRFHAGWPAAMGRPADVWREVRAGALSGLALYPVIVLGVGVAVALVLQAISGQPVEPPEQIPERLTPLGVATSIVYATVIAPIHEELFFRGILFRALADRLGFVGGALGSGVAFGLIHYIPGEWQDSTLLMVVMVATGYALAWIYRRRANLLAPIVAHATFNAIGLALIYALR